MASSSSQWEVLKKQARSLEQEIENKLVGYSKLGSAGVASSSGGGNGQMGGFDAAFALEEEIDDLLKRLTQVVNVMSSVLDNPPPSIPSNPSMMHNLQRHRDILFDYGKEFKKTKSNITSAREHAELLNSVRDDISSFKSSRSPEDFLLSERNKIDNSHNMADIVLEQAYETRSNLSSQRASLLGTRGRMGGVLSRFPMITSLISKINTRKRRDSLIMAGVVAACIIFLMMYWLNR
ncbi:hypothetical protein SmJEL517_g00838 [Synchytrium microbalum]|uniref:Golgi SNAP receptor complex member 1 n=1 Tax=Synchytrium microbalum TaxID=1806994 RepID=A0A507CGU4_9FUNG|nr:uncharacterized protein SmJEL517_g00838 [Synchytrium microbalum]TPX37204.1 hypothetical protein SmJEL517_g00838 [Synchytrium microbalum]